MLTVPIEAGKVLDIAFVGDAHLIETPPKSRKDDYFAAVISKINWIMDTNDVIVFLGDVFERSVMSIPSFHKVAIEILKRRKQGKRIFSILGNHDIPHYQAQSLSRTSLGLMNSLGLIKLFDYLEQKIHLPWAIDAIFQDNNIVRFF